MSDELRVRDHTQPCEHIQNRKPEIWGQSSGSPIVLWHCSHPRCPGGREITLTKVMAEWDGDMAVIRVDPGGEYWIDLEVDGDE